MKKYLLLLVSLTMVVTMSACTSSSTEEDTEAPMDETAAVDEQLEQVDAPATADESGETKTADAETKQNDEFLDQQLSGDTSNQNADQSLEPAKQEDLALEPAPTDIASNEQKNDLLPSEPPPPQNVEPVPAPVDSFAGVDTGGTPPTDINPPPAIEAPKEIAQNEKPISRKPAAPLRKIMDHPETRSGVLVNAVYVARPGDNYNKISKMIYGDSSKTKELKKVNPAIGSVKVGDKVYYNSPVRPDDNNRLLTYYEDMNIPPDVHVVKEGEDLKKVAKSLLGYDRAWMEVWSTNTFESKDQLMAGTEIRYWKSAPAPAQAQELAKFTPPPAMNPAPPTQAMNEMPPPPPTQAMNEMPPPPAQAEMPPPPPPPQEMAPPPPPPPPAPIAKKAPPPKMEEPSHEEALDPVTIGAAAAVLLAAVGFVVMRKRKQAKDMQAAFNDTQVGS